MSATRRPWHPGLGLRTRLFLLAATGLLPLCLAAALAVAYVVNDRHEQAQRSALELARALATAVDAQLRSTFEVLDALVLADGLARGDLADFRVTAARVAEQRGWRSVVVADALGQVVLSTSGAATPAEPVDAATMRQVIATRQPVVGRLVTGPRGATAFAVRAPVLQDGQLRWVVSAVLGSDSILALVARQGLPATSVVAIFDQAGTRVARSLGNISPLPSPSLQAMLDSGAPEGMGVTLTLEGVESNTGYSRTPRTGWTVAVGLSAEETDLSLRPLLAALAGGLAASLGLSALLAWWLARQVAQPIDVLKDAAAALGRGEHVHLPALSVAELHEVGLSLVLASWERERAQQEREMLLAQVTQALRQAEEAGRSKDEFLAMLGHELRNPLAPMANALQLMARRGGGFESERRILERQVAHMRRLVDDLLDVSRITGNRLSMNFRPLQLAALLAQACDEIRPALGARTLRLDVAPGARSAMVSGDEVRLAQVLANLLGNAVKFTQPQGRIDVRLREDRGMLLVEVADDGEGMPPVVLGHAFELFYQAPQGGARSPGGLGLGLPIVRSLVEMHGGTVAAASEGTGSGSRFMLRLPLARGAESAPAAPAALPSAGGSKVLLVDDNRDAADTLAELLGHAGHEVRAVYDPPSALATLEEFAAEVVVLDIGLPGMSGYELAGLIRARPGATQARLVALTDPGRESDMAQAQAAGFDAHLTKPAPLDELLALLARPMRAA